MILKISGVCKHCNNETKVIILEDRPISDHNKCSFCQKKPFEISKPEGLIYIVKNENQIGVKIGMTRKRIKERLKSLNSTGVPGQFEVVAIFLSSNLKMDEKRVHNKLSKKRIEKEHFQVSPLEAVLAAYRAFGSRPERAPVFYDYDEDLEDLFYHELESAKLKMKRKLKGRKAA